MPQRRKGCSRWNGLSEKQHKKKKRKNKDEGAMGGVERDVKLRIGEVHASSTVCIQRLPKGPLGLCSNSQRFSFTLEAMGASTRTSSVLRTYASVGQSSDTAIRQQCPAHFPFRRPISNGAILVRDWPGKWLGDKLTVLPRFSRLSCLHRSLQPGNDGFVFSTFSLHGNRGGRKLGALQNVSGIILHSSNLWGSLNTISPSGFNGLISQTSQKDQCGFERRKQPILCRPKVNRPSLRCHPQLASCIRILSAQARVLTKYPSSCICTTIQNGSSFLSPPPHPSFRGISLPCASHLLAPHFCMYAELGRKFQVPYSACRCHLAVVR